MIFAHGTDSLTTLLVLVYEVVERDLDNDFDGDLSASAVDRLRMNL